MNVLIIGNGGREHAFAWKIRQSTLCDKLFVAPGNAGTDALAHNVPLNPQDFAAVGDFCIESGIDLVVVGPEAPLVAGIRDYFESDPRLKNILMVGPGKTGAQLEGSKEYSKNFMIRHGIPTAKARVFEPDNLEEAVQYIGTCKPPIVLKADGLAAGKGVIISLSQHEAKNAIREMLIDKKFGDAGSKVLIEEFLEGIELSVFVLTDGTDYLVLPEAKDYKRIGENDTGPNTGGMGAVSPVPFATPDFMDKVKKRVIEPTLNGLQKEGTPFRGFIFIGLMNIGGDPYVIEYNVRMGDPETQAVLPRIKSDFLEALLGCARGELKDYQLEIHPDVAVTTVMVAKGYPGDYPKGDVITGLDHPDHTLVYHAGTKTENNAVVTNGGRVLAVTGLGPSIEAARNHAYRIVSAIRWDGVYFRKDIGEDLMKLSDSKMKTA